MSVVVPVSFDDNVSPGAAQAANAVRMIAHELKGLKAPELGALKAQFQQIGATERANIAANAGVRKAAIQQVMALRLSAEKSASAAELAGIKQTTAATRAAASQQSSAARERIAAIRAASSASSAASKERIAGINKAKSLELEILKIQGKQAATQKSAPKAVAQPGMLSGVRDSVFGGVTLGNLAAEAVMAGKQLAVSAVKAAVEAQAFKEASLKGLAIITKSGSEAQQVWDDSFKQARELGLTQRETITSMQSLLAQGFGKSISEDIIKATADLKAINPIANAEGIIRAISQIKATGKLQGDELLQLNEAGLSTIKVYEALGKALGKSTDEVKKLQEAGEISADQAITAILDSVKASTGKELGGAAAANADSFKNLIERLKDAPQRFFSGLELDAKHSGAVREALKEINDYLDPTTKKGREFVQTFSKITGETAERLINMAKGIRMTGEALQFIGETSLGGVGKLLEVLGIVDEKGRGAAVAMDVLIDSVFGAFASFGVVADQWESLKSKINLDGVGERLSAAATAIGSNLISGMVAGVLGSGGILSSAVSSVAKDALKAGAKVLEIGSPSKAARKLFRWLPIGAAKGVQDTAPMAVAAAKQMAANVIRASAQPQASISRTMSSNVRIGDVITHIDGRGLGLDELGSAFEGRMRGIAQQVAQQQAGAFADA